MTEPQVPGFDAVELLGFGSGGEVWLARERATGLPVALKRLRPGADLAARDRLRREAAVLAGVDHPHVVRLRAVHGEADGDGLVLVLDLAPGGSLNRLLAVRGRLDPGEVVTLAVPLAQALAAVHAQGLVHGDVTPANVLFAADGRPLLSDLGVSRLTGVPADALYGTTGFLDPAVASGSTVGPASDVHGLAATALAALTGIAPYDEHGRRRRIPDDLHPALVGALELALAADPDVRPPAEALAVAIFDAAPATPVRLNGAALGAAATSVSGTAEAAGLGATATHRVSPAPRPVDEQPPEPRRSRLGEMARRRSRAAFLVAGSGVTLALAAATGIAWAGASREPPAAEVTSRPATSRGAAADQAGVTGFPQTPTAAPTVSASAPAAWTGRWPATLAALDTARSQAFAAGDPELLEQVYADNAPALRRDSRILSELTSTGLRARGLRLTATRVSVQGATADRIRLAVTDVMPPFALVDESGGVVERRSGRGPRSWTVVLVREGADWRVYDVLRA